MSNREGAILRDGEATPVLEVFRGLVHTTTAVGTTAIEVPAAPLANRKAIIIQNLDSTKDVYLGGSIPDIYIGKPKSATGTLKYLSWVKSTTGNEWYAVSSGGGNPALTQPLRVYYKAQGGTETLGTAGTVGTLAAEHGWGWGDGDTLGYSTLYVRTNGTAFASNPAGRYEILIGYTKVPDTSSTYGLKLGPNDAVSMTLDGSCRIFAIASAASANTVTLEYL